MTSRNSESVTYGKRKYIIEFSGTYSINEDGILMFIGHSTKASVTGFILLGSIVMCKCKNKKQP